MHEFRYSTFLKVFIFIFCPALIVLFVWALLQYDDQNRVVYFVAILPTSVAMIGVAIFGMADVVVSSFLIADDRVILRSPFRCRVLKHDEIRGFRRDANYIRIIPIDAAKKEMKVSTYLKDSRAITNWLVLNYNNLDMVDGDEEEYQVLQNDELGVTEERRLERLNEARKVARFVNGGAWVLLAWLFAFPQYRGYAVLICCLYPLIAIFVTLSYREMISPDEYENSKLPSTGIALIVPGIALALRALMDFNILEYSALFWVAIALISVALTVMYMLPSFKSVSKPVRFYLTGMVIAFLNLFYAYGLVVEANCLLDDSTPSRYETTVAGKRVTKGRTTTYYLELQPWGRLTEVQEAKVTRDMYDSIHRGDTLVVMEHAGYLQLPWVEIGL